MPRALALRVLQAVDRRGAFSNIALDAELGRSALSAADAGLATALVYGVAKHRAMLDASLERLLTQPIRKLEPWTRDALRLGAFQVLFLDRVPAHAAVSESVKLVRKRTPHRAGLVNAVLRRLTEVAEAERVRWDVHTSGEVFAHGPLPASHLAEVRARLGDEGARRYLETVLAPAPLVLRVRPHARRDAVVEALRAVGCTAEPSALAETAVRVSAPGRRPDTLPPVAAGEAVVQDEAAQLASALAAPPPGGRVLDLCAGRGGKALHLADLVGPDGQVVAADASAAKLEVLEATAARLGAAQIRVCAPGVDPGADFDVVLVDAPCTGVGVIRRHPEIAWRYDETRAVELAAAQRALLLRAADLVRPAGVVLYCVCSDRDAEGSGQIDTLLGERPELTRAAPDTLVGPYPEGCDGFFVARLVRGPAVAA
jgi:16S rRNA (cytosine967-C5)-methyltransferase